MLTPSDSTYLQGNRAPIFIGWCSIWTYLGIWFHRCNGTILARNLGKITYYKQTLCVNARNPCKNHSGNHNFLPFQNTYQLHPYILSSITHSYMFNNKKKWKKTENTLISKKCSSWAATTSKTLLHITTILNIYNSSLFTTATKRSYTNAVGLVPLYMLN